MYQGFADLKVERFSHIGGSLFRARRKQFRSKVEFVSRTGGKQIILRWKANQGAFLKGGKIFRAKTVRNFKRWKHFHGNLSHFP